MVRFSVMARFGFGLISPLTSAEIEQIGVLDRSH